MDDYFLIEVRIPYQIDELLTVEKGEEFSVKYEEISELRESFNICYEQIGSPQKKEFVDYIEGGLISLRCDINSQKRVVKQMSKKVRKLEKSNFDLGAIEVKNNLYQNEEVLSCLQEQDVFLRDWIKEKRLEISIRNKKENTDSIKKVVKEYQLQNNIEITRKLTIREVALIHFYKEEQVTRSNADGLALKYEHNSGEKLFQKYIYYSSRANRVGRTSPFTKKKMENKIQRFENVIKKLPDSNKPMALDELKLLKAIYDNEF
ncbi:MAG: hypothetical protein HRT69_02360 [Flavobacteriaceae bacterium]|nr:hypothetical protein [Flavobacteriaceae bacterium]